MIKSRLTSLVARFLPFGGLLTAASRSSPFVSSLSERPPSDIIVIVSATGSAFTLAESIMPRLITLVRMEGADERLVLVVSDGTPDLERAAVCAAMWLVVCAVMLLGVREAGFALGTAAAHSLITSLCFRFLDESLSVQ